MSAYKILKNKNFSAIFYLGEDMKRRVLLVFVLSIITPIALVTAFEMENDGVPFWIARIADRLSELRTAIENLELSPTVNVENKVPTPEVSIYPNCSPNITVHNYVPIPNITVISTKKCNWENRIEVISKNIGASFEGNPWQQGQKLCSDVEFFTEFPKEKLSWGEIKATRIFATFWGNLKDDIGYEAEVELWSGRDPSNLQLVQRIPTQRGSFTIQYQLLDPRFIGGGFNFYKICLVPIGSRWTGDVDRYSVGFADFYVEYQIKPANC